ncbi:MAG: glycogen/starch/alpha-glucan phosphorylase, partial [Betaproteobacteria bacterium]|nr:glycogen/starch/alpha-glucan phosphorylase [Betaproteobacteria bacterium]
MQPSTLIAQAAPRASGTPGTSPATHSAPLAAPYCAALQRELRHAAGPLTPDIALRAAARSYRALLLDRWAAAQPRERARIAAGEARRVHYLSMEFLMGRALGNALMALGLHGPVADSLRPLGIALQDVLEREPDAALGNGGLGRLAACFLDSFAELGLPSIGYGLRYQYGMFAQRIEGGRQTETPDDWLRHGNDWEVPRPELRYAVGFGGRVEVRGSQRCWVPAEVCTAQAYDFIVPAHGSEQVSTLRQWHACATETIDLQAFNTGEYLQAAQRITEVSALNWVLYPDDSTDAGRMLRLRQEAFLVSATLQDIVARHVAEHGDLATFGLRNAVHLNDTHPALAPAELMRLLLDEHGLPWERAWAITQQAVSYTNHTLMPEALETWPVA